MGALFVTNRVVSTPDPVALLEAKERRTMEAGGEAMPESYLSTDSSVGGRKYWLRLRRLAWVRTARQSNG
jgi:transcription initiation factor TFIID subunit TAF12